MMDAMDEEDEAYYDELEQQAREKKASAHRRGHSGCTAVFATLFGIGCFFLVMLLQ